jgi:N-acetylmuramoyl-L-alanine amidase
MAERATRFRRRIRLRYLPLLLILAPLVIAATRGTPTARHAARLAEEAPRPAYTSIVPPADRFPGGLADGACLAYRPIHGDRHLTVFVDPGHGGADPGTSGTTSSGATVYEKDLTLRTGLDLLALLRQDGFKVVMSRVSDTLVMRAEQGDLDGRLLTATGEHRDIEARIACANAAGAQALVALHFNADADPSTNGAETLYDTARPFGATNRRLAQLAQQDVLAQLRLAGWAVPDRGVLDDTTVGTPAMSSEAAAYGHLLELGPAASGWLRWPSAMPGILCEPLFLTHPAEADVAASASGQRLIAAGLAQAITTFFAGGKAPARSGS